MDLRGYLTGGKKEKGKDDSSQSKRPTEEGASAKPPPPKRKFQQSWKSDFICAIPHQRSSQVAILIFA